MNLQQKGRYFQTAFSNVFINISDNDFLPVWRQSIIRTNANLLSIRLWGTYFNEILFKIQKFSFKKMHMHLSSAKIAAILCWP